MWQKTDVTASVTGKAQSVYEYKVYSLVKIVTTNQGHHSVLCKLFNFACIDFSDGSK